MMINLIICDEGFEEIVSNSLIKQFENIKIEKIETTKVYFKSGNELEDYEKLAEISYTFQSAIKVISNIETFIVEEDLEKTKENLILASKQFETNIKENKVIKFKTVKIDSIRKGNHEFKSTFLTENISKNTFKEFQRDYKKGDLNIFSYVKNQEGIIGIDISGRSLNKRDYKIFLSSNSLRATIAYNLIEFANIKKSDTILDPFMGAGTIVIEAGLYLSKKSPFFFSKEKFKFTQMIDNDWDSWFKKIDDRFENNKKEIYGFDSLLKFLKFAQKNAKIADINKTINLSKVDVDWIDTKFEEESIDKIITHPPALTEHGSKTKIIRIFKDFLKRSNEILKPKGIIVIINTEKSIDEIEKIAKIEQYKILEKKDVYEGKQKLKIIKLIKNKND